MASLNKVMVIGNLGADPEMRYTANGNAVTTYNVATNESWTDQAGERKERTEWFSVVTWNRLAETCAQYLTRMRLRTLVPAGALLLVSLAIFVVPGPLWELCLQAADGLLDVTAYVAAVTAR